MAAFIIIHVIAFAVAGAHLRRLGISLSEERQAITDREAAAQPIYYQACQAHWRGDFDAAGALVRLYNHTISSLD